MGMAYYGVHHQAGGQRGEYFLLLALILTVIFSPLAVTAPQIVFESRLGAHDVGNDCFMSIDGTNFHILQKGAATRGNAFGSHKYARKSALCYKLGIDILAGNLVWIGGPYLAGKWNDNFFYE
jgi:hypothetical protein